MQTSREPVVAVNDDGVHQPLATRNHELIKCRSPFLSSFNFRSLVEIVMSILISSMLNLNHAGRESVDYRNCNASVSSQSGGGRETPQMFRG